MQVNVRLKRFESRLNGNFMRLIKAILRLLVEALRPGKDLEPQKILKQPQSGAGTPRRTPVASLLLSNLRLERRFGKIESRPR